MSGQNLCQAQAEGVRNAVASTSTCSSSTVTTLQLLLTSEPKSTPVETKENGNGRGGKKTVVKGAQKTAKTAQSRTTLKTKDATAVTVHEDASTQLSAREKLLLATEVFNATLKSLSNASKPRPKTHRRVSSAKGTSPIPPTHRRSISSPIGARPPISRMNSVQRPLLERSASQVSNIRGLTRRSSSNFSHNGLGPVPGIVATAECARLALAYLRSPLAEKAAGKELPPLHVENGMLALIGKMLAHGLESLAIKELRLLKRRLESHMGADKNGKMPIAEKETLASLLELRHIDTQSKALPLAVIYQSYVLKIVSMSKKPALISAATSYLEMSSSSSPVALILAMSRAPENASKAARQLEAFSQGILGLCPSVASSDDATAMDSKLSIDPECSLRLQKLALETRKLWWDLAGHKPDLDKELLTPLSKCLSAFARRSTTEASEKYEAAIVAYEKCEEAKRAYSDKRTQGSPAEAEIYATLSSLAHSAEKTDAALGYAKKALVLGLGCSMTDVRLARFKVKVAAVALDSITLDQIPPEAHDALDSLEGNLKGTSQDLAILLNEVIAFRKAAMRRLLTIDETSEEVRNKLQITCTKVVSASIRFFTRFIGTSPPVGTDPEAFIRYGERVLVSKRVAKGFLDSVIACCKTSFGSEDFDYDALDRMLRDCFHVLKELQGGDESQVCKFHQQLQFPAVKISNVYWVYYLHIVKTGGVDSDTLIKCVRRSVEVLQDQSILQKETGLLPLKLERLGVLHEDSSQFRDGREAYLNATRILIEGGVLNTAAKLASTMMLEDVLASDASVSQLGKILTRLYKLQSRRKYQDVLFEEAQRMELPSLESTVFLDIMLLVLSNVTQQGRHIAASEAQNWPLICRQLFESLPQETYPLRRTRVAITTLRMFSDHDAHVFTDLLATCASCSTISSTDHEDIRLQSYQAHLKATLDVALAFRQIRPALEIIKSSLLTWQTIIDEGGDWASLSKRIYDINTWRAQMQLIVDYLDARGEQSLRTPALRLMDTIADLQASSNPDTLLKSATSLALQHLRLGYSGTGSSVFSKGEALLSNPGVSTEAKLQWHLAYAEYHVANGSSDKASEVLEAAESIATRSGALLAHNDPTATFTQRIKANHLIAEACYTRSLLALEIGETRRALEEARRCIKLNHRVWATLESRHGGRKQSTAAESTDTEMENVTQGVTNLGLTRSSPNAKASEYDSLNGMAFWPYVSSLFRGFMLMTRVYGHMGMLQDAIYFAEQGQKVATAVGADLTVLWNSSTMAELWTKGDKLDKAALALTQVRETGKGSNINLEKASYHRSYAALCRAQGETMDEMTSLDEAENVLARLLAETKMDRIQTDEEELSNRIGSMAIAAPTPAQKPARPAKGRPAAPKTSIKTAKKSTVKDTTAISSHSSEQTSLLQYRGDVLRRKALAHMVNNELAQVEELLTAAAHMAAGGYSALQQQFAQFRRLLCQAMQEMTRDLTFNVLPESTVAFPALRTDRRMSDHASKSHFQSPQQKTATRAAPKKAPRGKNLRKQDFAATLKQAFDMMFDIKEALLRHGPTTLIQQVSRVISSTSVLLSAVMSSAMAGNLRPVEAAWLLELPGAHGLATEKCVVKVERTETTREDLLKWPTATASPNRSTHLTAVKLQREYIDIIPPSWTAISLSLSEAKDELYITRYHARESPFILRIPLTRNRDDMDEDEEPFDFEAGKAELREIIKLSDFSTHAKVDPEVKGAKTEWWAEREALDTRLGALLTNIESIWLGGFRGILSQHKRDKDLLGRFQKNFQQVLDRHLPSRGGRRAAKAPTFDPRVLELFIGLGDATDDSVELEEPLLDLLYFIVDILQFNGERNAYDEIDFDSMTIETLEALRSYHSAANSSAEPITAHTILILDSCLHAFPWESMPCLINNSVSRLPSLSALRERILAAQATHPNDVQADKEGHYIAKSVSGTSILNPSGDLKSTQATLTPHLHSLPSTWSHHTTLPSSPKDTEKLFSEALSNHDLLLYFGHGSGAQYIRPRAVRKLDNCATTWLMGCSSSAIEPNGEMAPSGMVLAYLTAGSPAIVGTLWDVTDKDCDRFAVACGEKWGLWPKSEDSQKGKGKAKMRVTKTPKKARKVEIEEPAGAGDGKGDGLDMSLVEAVTRSREACYLKYLNGAALVVYGIPVYLH